MPHTTTSALRHASRVAARLTGEVSIEASAKEVLRAEELDHLRRQRRELEKEIEELTPQVMKDIARHDGVLVHGDEWKLVKIDSMHVTISKEALLQLGVKPMTIARATVKTPYAYPRLIRKGESDDPISWHKKAKVKR